MLWGPAIFRGPDCSHTTCYTPYYFAPLWDAWANSLHQHNKQPTTTPDVEHEAEGHAKSGILHMHAKMLGARELQLGAAGAPQPRLRERHIHT